MTDAIPEHTLKAAGDALRFQVLSVLNREFASSGLSIETVAARLTMRPAAVRRILSGRTRLTLRLIGELAWAIHGMAPEFSFEQREA